MESFYIATDRGNATEQTVTPSAWDRALEKLRAAQNPTDRVALYKGKGQPKDLKTFMAHPLWKGSTLDRIEERYEADRQWGPLSWMYSNGRKSEIAEGPSTGRAWREVVVIHPSGAEARIRLP